MNSPDQDRRKSLAGEYVLGTLDKAEVAAFNRQLETDAELQAYVFEWQERLQPLADAIEPVTPADAVWWRIRDQLGHSLSRPAELPVDAGRRRNQQRTRQKLLAWQWAGSLAIAASALLAVALWQTQRAPETQQFDVVSVVSAEDQTPLWVINASLQSQSVQVTALAPPAINDDQDHQLWMVKPNDEGVSSLGILPRDANVTVVNKVTLLREDAIAFAVSLEPRGGSPETVPSGPVVYQAAFNKTGN